MIRSTPISSRESPGYPSKIRLHTVVLIMIALTRSSASEVANLGVQSEDDPNLKNLKLIGSKIIPDVTNILHNGDGKFESLREFLTAGWSVLEAEGYQTVKDIPFTIIVPKVDLRNIEKTRLSDVILEHLVPGKAFDTFNEDELYGNSNGHSVVFKTMEKLKESQWTLNGLKILRTIQVNEKISVIFVDGFLGDRKTAFAKRNIQETNRYNEPQRLEMKNTTKTEHVQVKDSKSSSLMNFLAGMKTGTKVFQHFLTKSNVTQIIDDGHYTILIPSDNAFQRWHPIDWGFYPFSVQDFTENVLRNHFLQSQSPLRMVDIKNADKMWLKTLGGETVLFRNNPSPSVNNVSILADYTLPNGNQVFIISEVLFVSEAVVSRLHQMHKDKETPPLLAFPWFGAQFLSHSFLALERDSRFTQITRYLNNAEIAPYVSGANYTFFVPVDEAFEKLGFDSISDDIMASEKGVKMLLNHFVKGRLYDRDLIDQKVFETIGDGAIKVQRATPGNNVTVNRARVIETEIFVYNLGTMFYIDSILYSDILREYISNQSGSSQRASENSGVEASDNGISFNGRLPATPSTVTSSDVEFVPSEFTEPSGNIDDFHDGDDEFVTPKALPVLYNFESPKK